MTTRSPAVKGGLLVLLGTRKGCFLVSGDKSRKNWKLTGPYSAGSEVFHAVYDPRGPGTIFTAVNNMIWGPQVQISHDLGESWVSSAQSPKFTDDSGRTVSQLWHIRPGRENEPGVLKIVDPHSIRPVQAQLMRHLLCPASRSEVDDLRQVELPGVAKAFLTFLHLPVDVYGVTGQALLSQDGLGQSQHCRV